MKVLYFGASWCSQCHYWKPKFKELCDSKGYEFIELDADDNEAEFEEYAIRNLPTVVTIDGDKQEKDIAEKMYDKLK